MWTKDYKLVHSRRAEFTKKEKWVFPMILDQCLPSLRSQLEGTKMFEEARKKNDIVELLKHIRGFYCKHDQNNDRFDAVFNSIQALFINFEKNDQATGLVPCLVEESVKEMFGTMIDQATEEELKKKRGSATLLLIGTDRNRYAGMKNQMQQNMAMGTNNYPKSVDETMNILNTFAKMSKTTFEKKRIINLKEWKLLLSNPEI